MYTQNIKNTRYVSFIMICKLKMQIHAIIIYPFNNFMQFYAYSAQIKTICAYFLFIIQ